MEFAALAVALKEFFKSTLVKNILTVASGAVSAQIILLLFAPIITRIFGPEVFGLQGIFLSVISILSPIVTLRVRTC